VIYDQAAVVGYRVVVSPYVPYTSPEFLTRLRAHLAAGGVWVVGPYSGYLTGYNTNPLNGLLGELGAMLGLDVRAWTPARQQPVQLVDGHATTALMQAHAFALEPGDESLGTYGGDRLGGLAWGLRRRIGAGTVYVLGSEIGDKARQALYRRILQREDIALHALPSQIVRLPQVDDLGRRAWALVNTGRESCQIRLPLRGHDLLTNTATGDTLEMPGNSNAFVVFDGAVAG
jgi:beta-galactosidase